MNTIELPDDVYEIARRLAKRWEWTIEKVVRQALLDAQELDDQIEEFRMGRLGYRDL